ncbi:hypothetical protein NDK25_13735 [Niallia taxi]|nr:hypothetical protein [Niallia taxi]MDE5053295.1 hypothetical protein [Niallia taxi]
MNTRSYISNDALIYAMKEAIYLDLSLDFIIMLFQQQMIENHTIFQLVIPMVNDFNPTF